MRFRGYGGGGSGGGGGGVTTFNTRSGAVTLTSGDVTTALGDANIAYTDVANTFTAGSQVFLTGASGAKPVVFRETGGVAGTDELQIYYTAGSPFGAIFNIKAGGTYPYQFQVGGATYLTISSASISFGSKATDGGFWQAASQTAAFEVFNGGQYAWSSTGSAAGSPDTGLQRAAAGVVAATNGSSGAGWLQNSAGRARLTADVTNATTTFASLTDLTLTLVAGRKYFGKLIIKCNNSTAAEGFKLDFNGGTATMTAFWAAASELVGGTTVLGTAISTSLAGVINYTTITGETVIEVNVSMVCNAAGTFIPRIAENSHAAGTLTVELGSFLLLEDSPN